MDEADETDKLTKAYGFNPIAAQQGLWSTDPIWQASAHNGSLTNEKADYHYLHTDHLGTPMLATSKEGQVSWKAVSEAFGATGMIQSQTAIEMNLRFPGQYFDQETSSHYNFHRDYKPHFGRYVETGPIGLRSGVNTYQYVYARPNCLMGPSGQIPVACPFIIWHISCNACSCFDAIYDKSPPKSRCDDKIRHCRASCKMTRYMFFPIGLFFVGWFKDCTKSCVSYISQSGCCNDNR